MFQYNITIYVILILVMAVVAFGLDVVFSLYPDWSEYFFTPVNDKEYANIQLIVNDQTLYDSKFKDIECFEKFMKELSNDYNSLPPITEFTKSLEQNMVHISVPMHTPPWFYSQFYMYNMKFTFNKIEMCIIE